ncbi:MAG: L-seryl-tRNA(Sec) selenium transferase [Syntrophobacteraceae bacterium]
MSTVQEVLRRLPGVDTLLSEPAIQEALLRHPRKLVLDSIRDVLASKRQALLEEPSDADAHAVDPGELVDRVLVRLEVLSEYTLRPIVNATGIVIHTNLGRSLLPEEAIERLLILCRSYNNLEYDLEQGQRGSRYVHAEAILCELTGAEAALVVNNNAGAVLLVLNTLARGREVVVSRGQLVEIGGAFRIPDVMTSSGAVLREVGTTNRTHLRDYESAIGDETALLMKVHTSNYRIVGFTAEVPLDQLVSLGRSHGIPVVEDLGSGSFVDLSQFGLPGEPTVQEALKAGVDVVTFSGDKLLGGPQAGIILGRKDFVAACRKNPLTRALRVDKMTLAALEVTLRLYRDERQAIAKIPTLRMIAAPIEELDQRAHQLADSLRAVDPGKKLSVQVQSGNSQVGGGSLPANDLPSRIVAIRSQALSAQRIESFLRGNKPPIIARIESDQILLDVRTLLPGDLTTIQDAFGRLLQ